ncbi:hypothetical protein MK079_01295 [Candidatus Gracilibacteria bacterium]|nr:hypothetical protein [Candidatus Gracilibacteria bacterium]
MTSELDRTIELSQLYQIYTEADTHKLYQPSDIHMFYELNKHMLCLSGDQLEEELAHKWTHNKFIKLLEMIACVQKHDISLDLSVNRLNSHVSHEVDEIETIIFAKNNFEQILNKFIVPKAIMEKEVDYGYSNKQKKYIANLSYHIDELGGYFQTFEDIFVFDKNVSMEKRRSMRKKGLEICLASLLKLDFLRDDTGFKKTLFEKFDHHMKIERQEGTDKEIGSLHNVIYGCISGSDMYKLPYVGLDRVSHYSFLCFVYSALQLFCTCIEGMSGE